MMPPVHLKSNKGSYLHRFKALLTIYRVVSLFPVAESHRWEIFLINYAGIWSLVVLLLFTRLLYLAAYVKVYVESSLSCYIMFAIYGSIVFTNFFITIQVLRSRKRHAEIYSIIEDVDQIFESHVQVLIDQKEEVRRLIRRICLYSIVIIAFLVGYICSHALTKPGQEIILYAVGPGIANRVFCMMYSNFIELLHHRLEKVQEAIEGSLTASNSSTALQFGVGKLDSFQTHRILCLKLIYGKVWTITETLERIFGICLLLNVLLLCVLITSNLYWMILIFMGFSEEAFLGFWGKLLA